MAKKKAATKAKKTPAKKASKKAGETPAKKASKKAGETPAKKAAKVQPVETEVLYTPQPIKSRFENLEERAAEVFPGQKFKKAQLKRLAVMRKI